MFHCGARILLKLQRYTIPAVGKPAEIPMASHTFLPLEKSCGVNVFLVCFWSHNYEYQNFQSLQRLVSLGIVLVQIVIFQFPCSACPYERSKSGLKNERLNGPFIDSVENDIFSYFFQLDILLTLLCRGFTSYLAPEECATLTSVLKNVQLPRLSDDSSWWVL